MNQEEQKEHFSFDLCKAKWSHNCAIHQLKHGRTAKLHMVAHDVKQHSEMDLTFTDKYTHKRAIAASFNNEGYLGRSDITVLKTLDLKD